MAKADIGATFTSIISDQGPMTRSRVPQALIKAMGAEDGNVFHYEIVGNNEVRMSVLRGKNAERALAHREPVPAKAPAKKAAKKPADDFDKAFSRGYKQPAAKKAVTVKPAARKAAPVPAKKAALRGVAAAAIKSLQAKKKR